MLTLMRKFPALMFALLALVAVSCNTNDDPVDPNGTKPNMPTSVKAQSRSATSVGLKWDAPAGGVTPTGYRIYYNVKGSATKVAAAATSMNNSMRIIWMGANGTGIANKAGSSVTEARATLQAR